MERACTRHRAAFVSKCARTGGKSTGTSVAASRKPGLSYPSSAHQEPVGQEGVDRRFREKVCPVPNPSCVCASAPLRLSFTNVDAFFKALAKSGVSRVVYVVFLC